MWRYPLASRGLALLSQVPTTGITVGHHHDAVIKDSMSMIGAVQLFNQHPRIDWSRLFPGEAIKKLMRKGGANAISVCWASPW